ncbi:hypothetical protein Tco_0733447 [Tanacetum coccineum]
MKNLGDNFTFGDQFINDKPTKEDSGKSNVETEVESMVIVPIHQASSSVPPLSTPVIDLTPPKAISSTIQEPIFTDTTEMIIITLPLLPQQQSTTDPAIASHVSALEQLWDLPYKIDRTVNEAVKEVVQTALQALCEHFRDMSEAKMKEILHQRMLESGTYQLQPEHVALYEALEASMDRDNRDELFKATTKSRKTRRDDQDPPPLHQIQTKARRKSTISIHLLLTSPKLRYVPIPDDVHISDTKDTDVSHLPKIKPRPDWLKPLPEEERPETPEPNWAVPLNDLPKPENN